MKSGKHCFLGRNLKEAFPTPALPMCEGSNGFAITTDTIADK